MMYVESTEPMEELPLKELGESELESLVRGWRREAGSWFQRRGKAQGHMPVSAVTPYKIDSSILGALRQGVTQQWCVRLPNHFGQLFLLLSLILRYSSVQ